MQINIQIIMILKNIFKLRIFIKKKFKKKI